MVSVPASTPSTPSSTLVTATLSVAVIDTRTDRETTAPAAGDVIDTVGGVVSVPGGGGGGEPSGSVAAYWAATHSAPEPVRWPTSSLKYEQSGTTTAGPASTVALRFW